MTRIAIIAAMPAELKPLVRGWRHEFVNGVDLWRWSFSDENGDEGEWVAACAGAGVEAAIRAFAEVERSGPVSKVISAGWAGALSEEFAAGWAYDVSGVVDARTGERFHAAVPAEECWLVTSPRVADAGEKQRLAATYGAGMVDMEAAGVARMARIRRIGFYCVKGISDAYSDQLPDFNRFISPAGKFLWARFVLFAVLRPWHWRALARMNENSRKAAQGIAKSLLNLLDERGTYRNRNGFPDGKS